MGITTMYEILLSLQEMFGHKGRPTKQAALEGKNRISISQVRIRSKSQKSRKLEVFRSMTRTLILAHFRWGRKEGGG
ncbi:hypothetical protein AAG906_005661 [Vitis piasezkii]